MSEQIASSVARPGNPGWRKGVSGNPRGRPKASEDIAALCRIHTVEAINVILATMRQKTHKDRFAAAQALLDRGWGRPKQQLEVSADADAIGLHLVAARALVAAFDAGTEAAQPPTIEHRPDSEPETNALDAPKPTE